MPVKKKTKFIAQRNLKVFRACFCFSAEVTEVDQERGCLKKNPRSYGFLELPNAISCISETLGKTSMLMGTSEPSLHFLPHTGPITPVPSPFLVKLCCLRLFRDHCLLIGHVSVFPLVPGQCLLNAFVESTEGLRP